MKTAMRFPALGPEHPANRVTDDDLTMDRGQFSPKFTFDERCGIAAALLLNYSTRRVACAFGVNRRTVTRMLNRNVKAYRPVKSKLDELGAEAFIKEYFTEEIKNRLDAVREAPELDMTYTQAEDVSGKPNRKADSCAGLTVYDSEKLDFNHRIEVVWVEEHMDGTTGPGWYVRLLDYITGDELLGNDTGKRADEPVDPFRTSSAALRWAKMKLDTEPDI